MTKVFFSNLQNTQPLIILEGINESNNVIQQKEPWNGIWVPLIGYVTFDKLPNLSSPYLDQNKKDYQKGI